MPASVIHNGRVYLWKSNNNWKEQWLCLEENGHLVWKRKDAYQVKGSIELDSHLDKVFLPSPTDKQLMDKQHPNAYFFSVPMKLSLDGSSKKIVRELFAVLNARDMELWLDAMATSVGQWKIFKAVSDRHKQRVAKTKNCSVDCIEELLTYRETVPFLRTIWEEFLAERRNPMALQEISESMCSKSVSAALIFKPSPNCKNSTVGVAYSSNHRKVPSQSDFSDYATSDSSDDEASIDFFMNGKSVDSGVQSFSGTIENEQLSNKQFSNKIDNKRA